MSQDGYRCRDHPSPPYPSAVAGLPNAEGRGMTVIERRPVVACVLDLFERKPKSVRAWRPTIYGWRWAGLALPMAEEARRQWLLMRPDTLVEVSPAETEGA
jgi:hypothetical protein